MVSGSLIVQCFCALDSLGPTPTIQQPATPSLSLVYLGYRVISLMSSGVLCSCFEGFRLTNDNKTCHDINECEDPGSCSQHCVNNRGSFWCKCVEGYKLEPDMKRCKAAGKRKFRENRGLSFSVQFFHTRVVSGT